MRPPFKYIVDRRSKSSKSNDDLARKLEIADLRRRPLDEFFGRPQRVGAKFLELFSEKRERDSNEDAERNKTERERINVAKRRLSKTRTFTYMLVKMIKLNQAQMGQIQLLALTIRDFNYSFI